MNRLEKECFMDLNSLVVLKISFKDYFKRKVHKKRSINIKPKSKARDRP